MHRIYRRTPANPDQRPPLCHCEERSDVAIRFLSVPFGDGQCVALQGMRIATSGFALLAMTAVVGVGPSFGGAVRTPREGCPYGNIKNCPPA